MNDACHEHGANLQVFLAGYAATGVSVVLFTTLVLGQWDSVVGEGMFIALSVGMVLGCALLGLCGWCITTCSAIDVMALRGPSRLAAGTCGASSCLALIAFHALQPKVSLLLPLLAAPALLGLLEALASGARQKHD